MFRKGSLLSRLSALLLLILCVALVGVLVIAPLVQENRTYDALIADAQEQIRRYAAKQKDVKSLQSKLEKMKRARGHGNAYLREKSPSLASAALLGRLKQAVQKQGGTLASTQILKPGVKTDVPDITIRAQMKVSPKGLQHVFHQLEAGQPALFLDNVLISGRTLKKTIKRKGKVQQSWEELTLDVQYDVTGYLRAEASK